LEFGYDKQNLEALISKKEMMETALANNIPEVKLQQSLKAANCVTLSNTLREGEVLVELVRFYDIFHAIHTRDSQWNPPRYVAFVLRSKDPDSIQMIDLGDANLIEKAVTDFRKSIVREGDGRNLTSLIPESHNRTMDSWIETGYNLYKLLFYPLLSAIGACKRVIIAPDGDLARIPFETLPSDKDGKRLISDELSLNYLTTARDILRINRVSQESPSQPLVAVDPDFDLQFKDLSNTSSNTVSTLQEPEKPIEGKYRGLDHSNLQFDRLIGTENEGRAIAKLLNVQPLMKEEVLESSIKSFRSPRIFHIATHGFFLPNKNYVPNNDWKNSFKRLSGQNLENPMLRSGLALAGANTWLNHGLLPKEAEDGILTADDVSGMDLTNTELVVLSACQTGLGEVLTGEGVFGLRRAFVLAGAQTLVMSLWKVPDQQTKELVVHFCNVLLSGKSRDEALREAQLTMKEKYPDPYYWGAFICQGNPGPLSNQN
jgi:CHAT domain-containing protein